MKKNILLVLCLFIMSGICFAEGSQQELILGKWKFQKAIIFKNNVAVKEKIFEAGKLETHIEFLQEGKGITSSFRKGKSAKKEFTWEFLEEGIIQITPLYSKDQKGKARKLYIKELNEKQLILIAQRKIEKNEFKIELFMIREEKKQDKK